MVDPVSLGLMAGGIVGNVVGGIARRNARKNAGARQVEMGQKANEEILANTNYANDIETGAANTAGQQILDTGEATAGAVDNATNEAIRRVDQGVVDANGLLRPISERGERAGQGLEDLANGPGFSFKEFDFSNMDPSYQWRLQQGMKALNTRNAALGIARSGAAAKGMNNYAQNAASQEYQAAYTRHRNDRNDAFDRFKGEREDRRASLLPLFNVGANATARMSSNITEGAQQGGEFGLRGSTVAGTFRNTARSQQAQMGYHAGANAANRTYNGALARSNNIIGIGNVQAGSIVGSGDAMADMWSGIGNNLFNAGSRKLAAKGGLAPGSGWGGGPDWDVDGTGIPPG